MKSALELKKNKEIKRQQLQKEHIERVNEELLEIEKAQNKYESDSEDYKSYIDIQIIIKTKEAKDILQENGFYIDKVNQDIPYGITRIYLDEESYNIATKQENKISTATSKNEFNCKFDPEKEISLVEALNILKNKQDLRWWI